MRTHFARAALVIAVTCLSGTAFAHPGGGDVHGFAHGFMHPFGGLDHVLAMITVGLFAYQLGGRALWLVPASFVLAMTAGGALGLWGIEVPFRSFHLLAGPPMWARCVDLVIGSETRLITRPTMLSHDTPNTPCCTALTG